METGPLVDLFEAKQAALLSPRTQVAHRLNLGSKTSGLGSNSPISLSARLRKPMETAVISVPERVQLLNTSRLRQLPKPASRFVELQEPGDDVQIRMMKRMTC